MIRRILRRVRRPFVVRTITVEHSEIRVRSFPPLFEHRWVSSVQERIDAGAANGLTVALPAGEYWVREPLELGHRSSLVGAGSDKTIVSAGGRYAR